MFKRHEMFVGQINCDELAGFNINGKFTSFRNGNFKARGFYHDGNRITITVRRKFWPFRKRRGQTQIDLVDVSEPEEVPQGSKQHRSSDLDGYGG